MSKNKIIEVEIVEAEDLITGARIEPENEMPIEISAAICAGAVLGLIVSYGLIQIIYLLL